MPDLYYLRLGKTHFTDADYSAFLDFILPGIIAGSLLVFIPATGEYIIPDLLGGGNVLMIGRILYNEFNANFDWPIAAAIALLLILLLYQQVQKKETISTGVVPGLLACFPA